MRLTGWLTLVLVSCHLIAEVPPDREHSRRLVILKVDGLNADLLAALMERKDTTTGRATLPWLKHVFADGGTIFENFYVRGISLSAPSWSMLDTGLHSVIRGNVEYDRYTGQIYDYLNFFPFYLGYARNRAVDMPGVEVLDRAGIPLLLDHYAYEQRYQSFQLYQRGVRWQTLENALRRSLSGKSLFGIIENGGLTPLDSSLAKQTEDELEFNLDRPGVLYLDLFTGEVDHEAHATSAPAALLDVLQRIDNLVGRIWTHIENSPMKANTLFVLVSDHGMNNVEGVVSQTYSLPDLLNSPAGGSHHVLTNREQFSDYKIRGINPLVHRVVTPSTTSFYLAGEASRYPTAWLDIDGNERAALSLRKSDLNKLHILLEQLSQPQLAAPLRKAAAKAVEKIIGSHRAEWSSTISSLQAELDALAIAISDGQAALAAQRSSRVLEDHESGEDKQMRRQRVRVAEWQREHSSYSDYLNRLRGLLNFRPDENLPFRSRIGNFIPEMSLGEVNSIGDLQRYAVGLGANGLIVDDMGELDEQRSFRYVNYFRLLTHQAVANVAQAALLSNPIDFVMRRMPDGGASGSERSLHRRYLLYADDDRQVVLLQDREGRLSLRPIKGILENRTGEITWTDQPWRAGLPLRLWEDSALHLPDGAAASDWLSGWHTEAEWLNAVHLCRYSNGVIGVTEQLSPVEDYVPGDTKQSPLLQHYEKRRRQLVAPDLQLFAADHWNFNVRFPNPGGNHGSFLRISTHSAWMMAGAGVPAGKKLPTPVDSLNFCSTILSLLGVQPPMPDRIVAINEQ